MNKSILVEITEPLRQNDMPEEFLQIYQEALLLALKEQDIIDESQYLQCLQLL